MKKKGLLIVIMLSILCGCTSIKAINKKNDMDGVTVEIEKLSLKENSKNPGHYVMNVLTDITNNSDKDIMEVKYTISILDDNGDVLYDVKFFYIGQDKAIEKGQSVKDDTGTQFDLNGKPAGYSVTITEIKDSNEMPPVHLPVEGEPLYQAMNNEHLNNIKEDKPVLITLNIDHGGDLTSYEVDDAEKIDELVNLFAAISIKKETNEYVTDNYNSIVMQFADGTEAYISLNLNNLETSAYNQPHIYELNNLAPFIDMMKGSK